MIKFDKKINRHQFTIPMTAAWIFSFFIVLNLYSQNKETIRVIFKNEKRSTSLPTLKQNNVVYTSVESLANILNVRSFFNPQKKKIVLRIGSKAVKITAMNPFIMVDNIAYQMPLPTIYANDKIYVPLALFLETVKDFLPANFSFQPKLKTLTIRRSRYNITGVEVKEKINGSLIRFLTTKNFKISDIATSINRGWLNVTLYGGTLDSARIASNQKMGIVKKIIPFQFKTSAQISFLLDRDVKDRKVYVNKGEVLISLRTVGKIASGLTTSPEEERKRWLIDRIIIDPGHGGKDPGAIGKSGLKEKDVTLDIAKRLRKLLRKRLKVDVLMTRDKDIFIGLKERTRFANTHGGKLFISIHANANRRRNVRGFATYLLGIQKSEQAVEVARRENSVVELEDSAKSYEEFQDASYILNAIAQNSYLKESQDLAQMVNQSLDKLVKIPDLGVHQAGFYVLIGAAMPSILVETAFISNPYEERLLKTRSFRQKIAEAIYESVKRFKEKYEKGIG